MKRSKGVNIKGLSKIYLTNNGKSSFKAVDNISVDIKAGEFVTLLGPSGCGKTTTLRMIAGFEIPTEGEIFLGGDRINNLPPDKRDTAMVFQSYALFPHLNIYDNIAYGLKINKTPQEEMKERVNNILSLVGLEGLSTRYPNEISGGQQQRVALARALVMEPGVLLFDEPLSNLDAKLRIYMRSEIRKIQRKVGITAVYVTHDQVEAMSLSDRIIIMNKGVIEQVGTPKEIYYTPKTEFVADFIGTANFLDGIIEQNVNGKCIIKVDNISIEAYNVNKTEGEPCKILLRPEAIEIGEGGKLKGEVISSTFMGTNQEYILKVGTNILNVNVSNPRGKTIYNEGDQIYIDFDESDLHVI